VSRSGASGFRAERGPNNASRSWRMEVAPELRKQAEKFVTWENVTRTIAGFSSWNQQGKAYDGQSSLVPAPRQRHEEGSARMLSLVSRQD